MFAFVHIHKTGGLTVRDLLRKNFGSNHCDCPINKGVRLVDWLWVKQCYPQLQSLQGHGVSPCSRLEEVFEQIRYFTFLRDPFKRCLSHYQHKYASGIDVLPLKVWLPLNSNHMCRMLCGEENAERAIHILEDLNLFVGITDAFDESLLLWRNWSGSEQLELRYIRKNKARSTILKESVKELPQAIELIHQYNSEDQKLFDYVCNVIYPRQKEDYGASLANDLELLTHSKSLLSLLSINSLRSSAKRRLVYSRGLRKWRTDWMREINRAA